MTMNIKCCNGSTQQKEGNTIKVCFLISEHPFLDARIFHKEAKSLLNKGHDITMIVPRKNGYLFDTDGTPFIDKFLSSSFSYKGIKIITYEQEHLEKNLKTLHHDLHSNRSGTFRSILAKLGAKQQADIYHAHEFASWYAGLEIKRNLTAMGKKCKLIFDSHEIEPDPLIKQAKPVLQLKKDLVQRMLHETDFVITVSPSIKAWYKKLDSSIPIDIIYNSPPLTVPSPLPKENNIQELTLGFEGRIDKKRIDLQKLIQVAEYCNQSFPLNLKIIGAGANTKQNITIPSHLKHRIHFTGWVPYHQLPKALKDVDIGYIHVHSTASLNERFAMPNKFFSYLNNGIPVIVNECDDMKEFIENFQCGHVIKKAQADPYDYYEALLHYSKHRKTLFKMGARGREILEKQYSWEHMEKKPAKIYDQLK